MTADAQQRETDAVRDHRGYNDTCKRPHHGMPTPPCRRDRTCIRAQRKEGGVAERGLTRIAEEQQQGERGDRVHRDHDPNRQPIIGEEKVPAKRDGDAERGQGGCFADIRASIQREFQTRSRSSTRLGKIPFGKTSSTRMTKAKVIASFSCEETKPALSDSSNPTSSPPASAPRKLPRPPAI